MPMDRTKYPANWDEIATEIKEQAGWKCEQCEIMSQYSEILSKRIAAFPV